jgi:GDP-L-fucose synthase
MINKSKNIYVAGHNGMVGSALVRSLMRQGYNNIFTASRAELDLTVQDDVNNFFKENSIDIVFNAAAKVGGIVGNQEMPGDFIHQNILIQSNIIDACLKNNIERHIFLGSCCIYPKFCDQPMKEDFLLTGELEPTNEPYAVAKISGIISCQALHKQYKLKSVCPMPINLYGPGDNFHPEHSHVIPGLMRRIHEAKVTGIDEVTVWGTGEVKREYMHVDDCASGIIYVADLFEAGEMINIAPGTELTTRQTAELISEVVGYKGKLVQDLSKPDGTPRKYACSERIKQAGWKPSIDLKEGLQETYQWYLENVAEKSE